MSIDATSAVCALLGITLDIDVLAESCRLSLATDWAQSQCSPRRRLRPSSARHERVTDRFLVMVARLHGFEAPS